MTAAVERIGIGKEESVGGAAISLRRECRLPCGRFRRARRRNLSRRGDTLLADNIGVDFSSHCQARVHFLKVWLLCCTKFSRALIMWVRSSAVQRCYSVPIRRSSHWSYDANLGKTGTNLWILLILILVASLGPPVDLDHSKTTSFRLMPYSSCNVHMSAVTITPSLAKASRWGVWRASRHASGKISSQVQSLLNDLSSSDDGKLVDI